MPKNRSKKSFVPVDRRETLRQHIVSLLEGQTLSAREISGEARISEKEVYEHLNHIQKTMNKRDSELIITPAECKKCGFAFRKRERLTKPGKCPVCREQTITDPLFSIR